MARDGVWSPDFAHDGNLVAVEPPCQVRADRLPRLAAVVAAVQDAAGQVETFGRVRADEERRVPVPADGPPCRLRADAPLAPARQGSVLGHGVDDAGILRVHARLHAVAAGVTLPVAGADAD